MMARDVLVVSRYPAKVALERGAPTDTLLFSRGTGGNSHFFNILYVDEVTAVVFDQDSNYKWYAILLQVSITLQRKKGCVHFG